MKKTPFTKVAVTALASATISLSAFASVNAANLAEIEGNNSIEKAQLMNINDVMTGKIEGMTDTKDIYRVPVLESGKLIATLPNIAGTSWYMALYNSDGQKLREGTTDAAPNTSGTTSIDLGVQKGSQYYIEVSSNGSSTGTQYTLKTSLSPSSTYEHELNHSIEYANPITVNQLYKGSIATKLDEKDYFVFETQENGLATIDLKNIAGASWKLSLLDSTNKVIQSFNSDNSSMAKGNTSIPVGLAQGKYYVLMENQREAGNLEYNFKINLKDGEAYEKELNDTVQTATQIAPNVSYTGHINGNDPADFYKVTITKPTGSVLKFKNVENKSWRITLLDAKSKTITSVTTNDAKGAGFTELNQQLEIGDYYFKIENNKDSVNHAYSLSLNINDATGFTDVLPSHPYYNEVMAMRDLGIINGYDDGTFRPNDQIKRKNLVAMIARAEIPLERIKSAVPFKDVPVTHANYKEIVKLFEAGIIDGATEGKDRFFKPDGTLTRAQLAKIVVNTFKLEENTLNQKVIHDINVKDWYYPFARTLASHNIFLGAPTSFEPGKPVTRSEFAYIMKHALDATK